VIIRAKPLVFGLRPNTTPKATSSKRQELLNIVVKIENATKKTLPCGKKMA
jgi:hypothetical protein